MCIVDNSLVPFWSANGANCIIDEPAKQLSSGDSLVAIRHKFLRLPHDLCSSTAKSSGHACRK